MNLTTLLDGYRPYESIVNNLDRAPISVAGVAQSARAHIIASVRENVKGNTLIVTYSDMESRAMLSDLELYTDNAVMFPSKDYVFYNIEAMGRAKENARLAVLDKIVSGGVTVVASVDALMTYTADVKKFIKHTVQLSIGDVCDISKLCSDLADMGYKREEMIEGTGQFSVRGGIIDIFPPNYDMPSRIELWGDEVDSIRSFDIETQRTVENTNNVRIIPATEALCTQKRRDEVILELKRRAKSYEKNGNLQYVKTLNSDIEAFSERHTFPSIDKYVSMIYDNIPSVIDYFSMDSVVFVLDPKRVCERFKSFIWEQNETLVDLCENGLLPDTKPELYRDGTDIINTLAQMKLISLEMLSHTRNAFSYNHIESIDSKTTVSFHGKLEYLFDDLNRWQNDGYTVVVLAPTATRAKNLAGVFTERGIRARISEDMTFTSGETVIMKGVCSGGFEYPEIKFVLVCEQEIYKSERSRASRRRDNASRIKAYTDISVGDYVVHAAHGIGQYCGLHNMTVDGISKDYLKIQYKGSDVLYVPVDQLNLLYKYSGNSEEKAVKLNRLGTQEWTRTKKKAKDSTDKLAKELIKLYAQREEISGHAFSEDTPWQREFEDTFRYNETTDQLRSIEEVKADMEKATPMDRLLCGDVGFGKTEVALRAAFKAVCDSKQVVYLCPTTILAMQHFETFTSRMADFPITVEMLSRFRTAKQQTEILKKLKDGRVDIVIGTHRLLSDDVKFKDLGLLIVDEEQRFGVAHKEKIKALKSNVDVLTMTATPIPRTLHMAMTSVRDMSVLTEPPSSRYPVTTYVLEHDETVVCDAIRNELSRGGQVFYLYNRVSGIYHKAEWLKSKFPDVNIAVGHGKMNEAELEDIMYDMVNGTTQILVCTTIIETGLDIPNANTIIIENADRMGLAQLYQLRGRVGRSNRGAYAYLTYKRDKVLSDMSSKRLSAIREFTEFGSGFKIAMRDLEIRGAGNLLGAEQHGHMDNVGYDMYCKLLGESINEAKGQTANVNPEVTVDIDINAYIPERYIPSPNQRIDIYKKIAAIETEDDKLEICDELTDRYGDMPKPVMNIISVATLKLYAADVGCIELLRKGRLLTLRFSDGMLSGEVVFGLDKKYPARVKVSNSEVPALTLKLTEKDTNILEFVKNLLILIKELQNTQK